MARIFRDRREAGRLLGERLVSLGMGSDALILGLPRGGVEVAMEVAAALGAQMDVLVVRKLGVPGHEELAMGAIGPGGVRVLHQEVVGGLGISRGVIEEVERAERRELERREGAYRPGRPPLDLEGRRVVLVDDGIATGSTMRAAVAAVKAMGASETVVAVPVGAPDTLQVMEGEADQVVCLEAPETFHAVGSFYEDFRPVPDQDVIRAMAPGR